MQLTLVAPGLLSLPHEALQQRALARLSPSAFVRAADADDALLDALGIAAAAAPLAALGAGLDAGMRWIMRADPVTMSVSHDDVRLVGRVDDLTVDEAHTLRALLAAHFAADALDFVAPRADAWFVTSERTFAVDTSPIESVLGRPLRERLPGGADARHWRRWLTEAQMLLHEHALATRPHAVNGLWFAQGGRLPERVRGTRVDVRRTPRHAGDVAGGIAAATGGTCATLDDAASLPSADRDGIVVVDPIAMPGDVARFVTSMLIPALEALDAGRIAALAVIADGGGGAGRWTITRRRWLDRLRSARAFEPPPLAA